MQGSQNKKSLHAQLQLRQSSSNGKTLVNESRRAPLGQDQGTRCCSMSKQLQQHLDRLQHEHPVVRRHAVAGVFQLLAQHSMYASKHGQDALQVCLRQTHQDVLEETLLQLQAFMPQPDLGLQDAADMTLAAIAVPGSAAVIPSLVEGLFRFLQAMVTTEQAQLGSWAAHPLNKALLAQPLSHPSLMLGTQRILSQAAQAGKYHQQLLDQLLVPFVSFVLLHSRPRDSGHHVALKCGMHAQLVRAACALPAIQANLLPQLVSYLGCYSWSDAAQAAWLASLIPDLIDAVQSTEGPTGDDLAEQLAVVLLQLLCEEQQGEQRGGQQGGQSLHPFLLGLRRLATDWPPLLLPYIPLLGSCITTAGNEEAISMLHLISRALENSPAGAQLPSMRGLLSLPLISTLALHPCQTLKAWAGNVHQALSPAPGPQPSKADGTALALLLPPAQLHGRPCLVQQATTLLNNMWQLAQPTDQNGTKDHASRGFSNHLGADWSPLAWLGRFRKALQTVRDRRDSEQAQKRVLSSHQDEVMRMMLTALLDHPQLEVQATAAEACAEAVMAFPITGISLLPLLLYKLQRSVVNAQQGAVAQSQRAEVQMALLRAVPCMAMHQTALPFVQRALMPFAQPGAPELLLALGLKMYCQLWVTTSRGFNSLLAGLSGFAHAHPHAGDMLRTVRAACVRDVCRHDSSRGVELVKAIQECLEDPCEAVAALGLQAVALLCEDDVLEFYAAWRVVHKAFPKMPSQELVAVEWVGMLKHGVLDADVYPDKSVVIVDMLWAAAAHASNQVRAAAYQALAAYPMDLLETLQALRPLQNCVQKLVAETDARGRAECEGLVGKALAHEHLRRRRYIGSSGKAAHVIATPAHADPSSPESRLMQALPKQLLQQSEQQARRPNAGVILLLWGPPAPSQQNPSSSDRTLAAQQAATAYVQTFEQVLEMPFALGSSQHALALHSWGRFLARWGAAVKAGQGRARGGQRGPTDSVDSPWMAIKRALDSSSPVAAENAAVAAAALTAMLPPGSHATVTEVVQNLRAGMDSQSAGMARACTLAVGPAAAHLHPTDTQTRQEVVEELLSLMASCTSPSVKATCAESLGLFVASSTNSRQLSDTDRGFAVQIAEGLLRLLCTLCRAAVAPVTEMVQSLHQLLHMDFLPPVQSPVTHTDEQAEAVFGIMAGLAHTAAGMPASPAASFATALLCMAQTLTTNTLHKDGASDTATDRQNHVGITVANLTAAEDALLAGCCVLQSITCEHLATEQQQQQAISQQPQQQQQQTKQSSVERSQTEETAVLLSKAVSQLRAILVASKHGKLTGAAAAALGSVLNSALTAQLPEPQAHSGSAAAEQTNKGSAQHAQRGMSVNVNESELTGGVSDLLAAGDQVAKLPSAAMGKQGVAMGLSTLLEGFVGPHGRAASSGLLSKTGWAKETEDVLEALVQMSLHDINPRVATAASWSLAAACHALRHRKTTVTPAAGTSTAVGAQMRALAGLPEDGAMRSLVQIVLAEAQGDSLSIPDASMAAVMRCLARAPRLPPLDWGTPCHRLLNLPASSQPAEHPDSHSEQQATDSTDEPAAGGDVGLASACLLLAFKHGGVASHGLGELLEQLMTQQRFGQFPAQLQHMLLTGLPEVLQALSSQRSASIVSTLSTLSFNLNQQRAGQFVIAVWTGLTRLLHSAQDSNSSTAAPPAAVTEAAHRAVYQLLQQLPLPPFLLAGESLPQPRMKLDDALHSVTAAVTAQAPVSAGIPEPSSQRRTDAQHEEEGWEQQAWGAACACLQEMPTHKVAHMLSTEGSEWAVQAAFAQAVLVQRNNLPSEHLKAARRLCVSTPLEGLPAVMSALAAAVHQPSLQQTLLLEALDAVQAAEAPEQAVQLVGLLTAHWQARPHVVWPVQLVTAVSAILAVQSLPYTLPALLQRQEWLQVVEPVTRRLIRLVGVPEAKQQQGVQDRDQETGRRGNQRGRSTCAHLCAQDIPGIAAACLVALRQHLAEDAWQHMPQVLACMRQCSGQ